MAFAFRKIISNMGYFKKSEDGENSAIEPRSSLQCEEKSNLDAGDADFVNLECAEPDSTSIQNLVEFSTLQENVSIKKKSSKKSSLSDTDLLTTNLNKSRDERKRARKLKLDIKKANQSFDDNLTRENVENTPKQFLLECKSSEIFSERMKRFDFSKSFELDSDSDHSSYEEDNIDIESLSEDDDISILSEDKTNIKMCRKVGTESHASNDDAHLVPSATPESFADVEVDKNEEERVTMLLEYQMKFEKIECLLKKLITEFQFHIEVSKVFHCKSFMTALPGSDVTKIPKALGEVTYIDDPRGVSPMGTWNIIVEKEDKESKNKFKNQLRSIQNIVNNFVVSYLQNHESSSQKKPLLSQLHRSITYDVFKGKMQKKHRMSNKKKFKHFDYPDIRDAMLKLFSPETIVSETYVSLDSTEKCVCRCHEESQTDSGLKMKSDDRSMSITSSIGNFSLDNSTLTAYSESLDQIISYNSFQDNSLYSNLLQKASIERITFYVQAHSIQIKCETSEEEFESKSVISFYCPSCKVTEYEENGILKHILGQEHCEKIHFLYKTAYIKKCVAAGKEIQPSTVLNPMKMYRDENKIVCFGDAVYACSLCFENVIVGESVLMAHCSDTDHIKNREKLAEIFE